MHGDPSGPMEYNISKPRPNCGNLNHLSLQVNYHGEEILLWYICHMSPTRRDKKPIIARTETFSYIPMKRIIKSILDGESDYKGRNKVIL